ncbi:MAG TPA: TadE family protein [Verrucomicrobiae bacterium]|nr:TadE family protein [Verrucomicrobiae bacterium]
MRNITETRHKRRPDGQRSQRGAVLVEFGLVASIVILLTLSVFQIGFIYFAINDLNNAARDGARYGSIHPSDDSLIKTNVVKHLSFANNSQVHIDITRPDGNTNADSRITVTLQYTIPSFMPLFGSHSITNSSTMRIERQS